MKEQIRWKPVKGFEGLYEISDLGDVRRVGKSCLMKKYNNGAGVIRVGLSKDGVEKKYCVKNLMTMSFLDIDIKDLAVVHIDGDQSNNAISNLMVRGRFSGDYYKEVIDIESGRVYDTLKHAAKSYGIPYSTARQRIAKNQGRFKHLTEL